LNNDSEPTDIVEPTFNLFQIRHMALRNVVYHQARMRVLDRRNRWATFITLVLGTAVAADIGKSHLGTDITTLLLGGSVAVIGAAQLVFDFGGLARLHQILHRDFTRLLAETMKEDRPSADQCRNWTARIVDIGADAPPVLRALDAVADNEANDTLGALPTDRLVVSYWQNCTKHWLAHAGVRFKRIGEA